MGQEETETVEPKRKVGRQEAAKIAAFAAIDKQMDQSPDSVWDLATIAYNGIQALKQEDAENWPGVQAQIVLDAFIGLAQQRAQQRIKSEARSDARQGVLALPGFELVKPWVKLEHGIAPLNKVTLKQHKDSVKEREKRIKAMEYPRWSEERMKNERAALVQERKLDRRVAPLAVGKPDMEMGKAMELYQEMIESPKVQARMKAGAKEKRTK